MTTNAIEKRFIETAEAAGAVVLRLTDISLAVDHIAQHAGGNLLLPPFASGERAGLAEKLRAAGCQVIEENLRSEAPAAAAGLTGANFAIAETGTLVLESTDEAIRLASTLPERHFVLLDAGKVLPDSMDAVPVLRRFHQEQPVNYLGYITGPSRTADIERVLTIGVHGPKELHILILESLSSDPMEM